MCHVKCGGVCSHGQGRRGGGCVLCQLDEGNEGIGQQAINDGA